MNEEEEEGKYTSDGTMILRKPDIDTFNPSGRAPGAGGAGTTPTTTSGGTPQYRLKLVQEEAKPTTPSADPYNDTNDAKLSVQEVLKKMLFGEKKGQGTLPVASLSQRLGYNLSKPAQEELGINNGYYDEGPSAQLMNRTVDGVQAQMDAAVPTMSQRLPYRAERLKYYYAHQLATRDDNAKGLYNPIPANPFQRMAYIMKQRLREFSLYNRD